MQVKVSARHGHLSEEHQKAVADKVEKLLHFFDRLLMIEVTVDFLKGDEFLVEILAEAEHKYEFVGKGQAGDLMVAVTAAKEKVKQQIKHYKEKVQDHRRDPSHGGTDGIKH